MHSCDHIVIKTLDQLVAHAEQFVCELKAYSVTPASALLAAEQVAADFHQKRRTMLEDMMLFPMGEC